MMTLLPSIAVQSIISGSSLNDQYGFRSCYTFTLLDGQPIVMKTLRPCRCMLFCVTFWMSCIVMHAEMFVVVSIALILSIMLAMASSLFSKCFCLESQLEFYRSIPGFYIMYIVLMNSQEDAL